MTTHDIQNDCHGLDTPQQVFFYEQDFYVLSNFSAFQINWGGETFATSEMGTPDFSSLGNSLGIVH